MATENKDKQGTDFIDDAQKEVARISWGDHLRAIGIILVVWGHTEGIPDVARRLIYGFHMPLFFVLSGYFLSTKKLSLPFLTYVNFYFKRLMIPFLFFATITFAFWCATSDQAAIDFKEMGAGSFVWGRFAKGLISGDVFFFKHYNSPLWFFWGLFSGLILYYWLHRIANPITVIGILVAEVIVIHVFQESIPRYKLIGNIDLAPVIALFIAVGFWARQSDWYADLCPQDTRIRLLISVAMLVTASLAVSWNGTVDISWRSFGNNPLVFYLAALVMVVALQWIVLTMPPNQTSSLIAASTIVIFPLHFLTFGLFHNAIAYIGINPILVALVQLIIALPILVGITWLFQSFAPTLIGEKRSHPTTR